MGWQVFGSVLAGSGCCLRVLGRLAHHLTWGQTVTETCWSAPLNQAALGGLNWSAAQWMNCSCPWEYCREGGEQEKYSSTATTLQTLDLQY